MDKTDISDNAVRLWTAFFKNPKSTLRFGGSHAEMEITPEARKALDELIEVGAAMRIQPDDQWPGSEHYGSGGLNLRPILRERPHLNPFTDPVPFVSFRKKSAPPHKTGD